MNFLCCQTLTFDKKTGQRISPKNSDENNSLPFSWDEFISLYQLKQGIEACPLCDILYVEQPHMIIVCSEEDTIVCHRIPTSRLNNILELWLFLNKQGKSPMVLRNSLKMVFSLKTSPHISSTSHEINFRDLKAA